MRREAINPQALAPPGHFDHAVRIGDVLYVSALSALSHVRGPERDHWVPGDIEAQTELTYRNLQRVVEAAGGTMANFVALTVFYTDVKHWPTVDQVTRRYLPERGFTRTGFLTRLVVPGLLIQIEGIAVLD